MIGTLAAAASLPYFSGKHCELMVICTAGTFGRVLECWDRKNRDYVAIKIIRSLQKYRDAAMIEVPSRPHPAPSQRPDLKDGPCKALHQSQVGLPLSNKDFIFCYWHVVMGMVRPDKFGLWELIGS